MYALLGGLKDNILIAYLSDQIPFQEDDHPNLFD